MDITKKRWDHVLQAWVMDFSQDSKPTKLWDNTTRTWVDEKDYYEDRSRSTMESRVTEYITSKIPVPPPDPEPPIVEPEDKEFVAVSCQTPPDYWKKKRENNKVGGYGYNYTSYKPCYPWEGVSRAKWPAAWWNLLLQYHAGDWHKGHYISDELFRKRIKGEYQPYPKYGKITSGGSHYYGPYSDHSDYSEG